MLIAKEQAQDNFSNTISSLWHLRQHFCKTACSALLAQHPAQHKHLLTEEGSMAPGISVTFRRTQDGAVLETQPSSPPNAKPDLLLLNAHFTAQRFP